MKKITVIYWTSTGNTEVMAEAIAEGAISESNDVTLLSVGKASIEDYQSADVVLFGCSAMSVEEIDDSEMLPFIESIQPFAKDKKTALFGSYGWGDGTWMTDWETQMTGYGSTITQESLMINELPDAAGLEACKNFGKLLYND